MHTTQVAAVPSGYRAAFTRLALPRDARVLVVPVPYGHVSAGAALVCGDGIPRLDERWLLHRAEPERQGHGLRRPRPPAIAKSIDALWHPASQATGPRRRPNAPVGPALEPGGRGRGNPARFPAGQAADHGFRTAQLLGGPGSGLAALMASRLCFSWYFACLPRLFRAYSGYSPLTNLRQQDGTAVKLSILMPVYNEAETVQNAIKRLLDVEFPVPGRVRGRRRREHGRNIRDPRRPG